MHVSLIFSSHYSLFVLLLLFPSISMLFRLFLVVLSAHVCLAGWVDTVPVVLSDGSLNKDNTKLAGWLRPEELVNMGDSQLLDGTSHSWTPTKGSLLASASHVNGPMVKRNQANGFPVVRFNSPSGPGAAIRFLATTGTAPTTGTVFLVARLDLASTSDAATYQHLWTMGAVDAAAAQGLAVSKNGKVLVGIIGADPPADPPLTAGDCVSSAGSVNAGSWHIYALDVTASHHVGFVDGTGSSPLAASATAFATIAKPYADAVYQIGNGESLVNGALQGDIAEVHCAACI